MQLRLLNFHKLLANIATNLVGAFVPLIILEATNSLALACVSYGLIYLIRAVTILLLRKPLCSKPQLVLLLRLIPMVVYSIFICIMETNLWVGVVGVVIFCGLSESCKRMPMEIILNYSSMEAKEESSGVGLTRLIEQIGVLIAILVGGFLLDINKTIVIIIAVVLYTISCVPLAIYYYKSKNDSTFNKDAVSNAQLTFKNDDDRKNIGKQLTLKILIMYGVVYFMYCTMDALTAAYNIHLFVSGGSYAMAGVFNAIYNGAYGIGNYIFGKINIKKDLMPIVVVSCIVCGLCTIGFVVDVPVWLACVMFAVIGFTYASVCFFNFQRIITKSRILGISNTALFVREDSSNISVVLTMCSGCFGTMIPTFVVIGVTMLISAWLIPHNEEKTRRWLVDYLQYNEIVRNNTHSKKIYR